MAIGERLRSARSRAGLSLRRLAQEVGVSAQAISKYERGLDIPSSGVLLRLAHALDVKTEYFLRPRGVAVVTPAYRCRTSLPARKRKAILGGIQEWLERYLDVESLLGAHVGFEVPPALNCHVRSPRDVERLALGLRQAWGLGEDAIESVVDTLEEHGVKVALVAGDDRFDACTFWADGDVPVIAVSKDSPGDRLRFSLAHELGHLVLQPVEGLEAEKAAQRFAGAILVPEGAARRELGPPRRTLSLYELHMLKHKYGLSMQAWICRAQDLGILAPAAAQALFREFRSKGWHRQEPGDPIPREEPKRLGLLIMRALAEDIVSPSRAAELLGEPLAHFLKREAEQHGPFIEAVYH